MAGPKPTKYWCEYCRMFVHNNQASRKLHEATGKHKFNIQMHLRGIYKDQDKKTKEDAQMKKMMAQIEKDALKQYGADTGKSVAALLSSSGSASSSTNYGGGKSDKVVIVPQASTSTKHVMVNADTGIGEWEEVIPEPVRDPKVQKESSQSAKTKSTSKTIKGQSSDTNVYANVLEDDDEHDIKEDVSSFKITEKALPLSSLDNDDGKASSAVFKKRKGFGSKAGGADKKRNIRVKE